MINMMTKLKQLKKKISDKGWQSIEDWNYVLDAESRSRFINERMAAEKISYDEVWRRIREDPEYSMLYKMCSPAMVMMLKMKGGKEAFRDMLTPEEREVFDNKVVGKVNFKKAFKDEYRRQKKRC